MRMDQGPGPFVCFSIKSCAWGFEFELSLIAFLFLSVVSLLCSHSLISRRPLALYESY